MFPRGSPRFLASSQHPDQMQLAGSWSWIPNSVHHPGSVGLQGQGCIAL